MVCSFRFYLHGLRPLYTFFFTIKKLIYENYWLSIALNILHILKETQSQPEEIKNIFASCINDLN